MATGFNIDPEKCTECQRCMAECSLVKAKSVLLGLSRITIKRNWPDVPDINICLFDGCEGKPCIKSCPVNAITLRKGLILIERDECTGCGACVDVCPYSAIRLDNEDLAFKCDFCDGDPSCVKECVTEAITVKGH
jgi:Fe-S-cluster-containing hydrogenase component 2